MPLVLVTRDPYVTDKELSPLLEQIRQIVAEQLTVPGTDGELSAREVEVRVQNAGTLDQNTPDVAVIIWANEYPDRLETLDERRAHIAKKMKELLPPARSGSLWILLQPGSFEEW